MPGNARDDGPAEDQVWLSRVTALAIIGFSVSWVLVTLLADLGLYGNARFSLEVNLYRDYAGRILDGMVPYRDFAFEYPPLALVPILGPTLIAGSPLQEDGYREAFGLFMAGIGMVTMVFVMRSAAALGLGRRDMLATAAVVASSPVLLGPLMLSRYDMLPALFGAAAMWAIIGGRHRVAGVALGLGVLAKVYPIVLAPFIVAYLWRRFGRREAVEFAAVAAGTVAFGLAPFFIAAPGGVLSALTRAFERPLQVEAIGAVLLYVANAVTGLRLHLVHTFDSYNLTGTLADSVAQAQTLILGAVLLAALVLFLRGRPTPDRLAIAAAAGLCAYVAFGKVLSPQYLIWLIAPLVLVRGGRWSRWSPHLVALVVAIVLTGLYYPRFYSQFFSFRDIPWIAVVLGRDLVLILLTGYLLLRLRARGDEPAPGETAFAAGAHAAAPAAAA